MAYAFMCEVAAILAALHLGSWCRHNVKQQHGGLEKTFLNFWFDGDN
jgi:hypothetical protein